MALLDVSSVLTDPDFQDCSIVRERRMSTVGSDGITVISSTSTTFCGVVTSDSGDQLKRGADGERIAGSITIHTSFELADGGSGQTADIVQWRGRRYTVSSVLDFGNFGRGFCSVGCDLIPLSG